MAQLKILVAKMCFYSCLLLIIHTIGGNCRTKYDTLDLPILYNTVNHNNDKDLSNNLKMIVLITGDSQRVNNDVDHDGASYKSVYDITNIDKTKQKDTAKPVLRRGINVERIERSKTGKLLKYQHKKKMEELVDYLRDHYSSTNYFYSEMKRIQRQHSVKDKMREMIDYLEEPDHWRIKKKILYVFDKIKKKKNEEMSVWNAKTNDLVINVLKDPYNDGVIN